MNKSNLIDFYENQLFKFIVHSHCQHLISIIIQSLKHFWYEILETNNYSEKNWLTNKS